MSRTPRRFRWRAVTLLAAVSTLTSLTTGVAAAEADNEPQANVPWQEQAGPDARLRSPAQLRVTKAVYDEPPRLRPSQPGRFVVRRVSTP